MHEVNVGEGKSELYPVLPRLRHTDCLSMFNLHKTCETDWQLNQLDHPVCHLQPCFSLGAPPRNQHRNHSNHRKKQRSFQVYKQVRCIPKFQDTTRYFIGCQWTLVNLRYLKLVEKCPSNVKGDHSKENPQHLCDMRWYRCVQQSNIDESLQVLNGIKQKTYFTFVQSS